MYFKLDNTGNSVILEVEWRNVIEHLWRTILFWNWAPYKKRNIYLVWSVQACCDWAVNDGWVPGPQTRDIRFLNYFWTYRIGYNCAAFHDSNGDMCSDGDTRVRQAVCRICPSVHVCAQQDKATQDRKLNRKSFISAMIRRHTLCVRHKPSSRDIVSNARLLLSLWPHCF